MAHLPIILSDQMLDAAFAFRKAQPWNDLTDSDVFAVKLPDGKIGYCCVMGNAGEHHSLGLYVGEEGFATYLKSIEVMDSDSELAKIQAALTFDSINCDFMNADVMASEVKDIIKAYAQKKGVKIPRPFGWPCFARYASGKGVWPITSEKDAEYITTALKAAVFFNDYFSTRDYEDVGLDPEGFYPEKDGGKEVPFVIPTENGYEVSRTVLPPLVEDLPKASFDNFLLLSKIKALKKTKAIQIKYVRFPFPIAEEDMDVPCIPGSVVSLENVSGMMLPAPTLDVDSSPESIVDRFVTELVNAEMHPSEIHVDDQRTYNLFEDFCKKTGITLKKQKKLPILEDAVMTLMAVLESEEEFED